MSAYLEKIEKRSEGNYLDKMHGIDTYSTQNDSGYVCNFGKGQKKITYFCGDEVRDFFTIGMCSLLLSHAWRPSFFCA